MCAPDASGKVLEALLLIGNVLMASVKPQRYLFELYRALSKELG